MESVIAVDGLRKSYGGLMVVDGVSFDVARGEVFGVLGPNGAGKTTTVECVQGLRQGDSGTVRILGLDPWHNSAALRRRIGSQLQESSLPDRIRVGEALKFFAHPGSDWEHLLNEWGLHEKRNTAFANLSGGQRQRLFVALALVNRPDVVFLDEMTTGLDPAARHVAWDLIEAIKQQGTTVVLVTHFMEEAEHLCDRVAVINHGQVIAAGRPSDLIAAHAGEVRVHFTSHRPVQWLKDVPFVHSVEQSDGTVEVLGDGPVLAHVGSALVAHGDPPSDLHVERMSLEDVFLRLTGENEEVT